MRIGEMESASDFEKATAALSDGPLLRALNAFEDWRAERYPRMSLGDVLGAAFGAWLTFDREGIDNQIVVYFAGADDDLDHPDIYLADSVEGSEPNRVKPAAEERSEESQAA